MKLIIPKQNFKIFNYRLVIITLLIAIILLGIVLPASFSDHYKLLHFSAHFGTSFLVAYFLFKLFTVRFRVNKVPSFIWSFIIAFIFGAIYKFFEISATPFINTMPLPKILDMTGFYISMSQNTAGILSAFVLVIYFDKLLPIINKIKRGATENIQPSSSRVTRQV
jgi:hypothetical protein